MRHMKRAQATAKRPASGKTKLSEIRDSAGDLGLGFRSDAKLPNVRKAAKVGRAASLSRKPKAAPPDPRVMEYAEVLAHAVEIFGSRIRANAWLNRPSRIFNNQSPLQVLTEDPASVEEELVRIDEGIFF
jgi:uncharacterized protein (DUF2384 family)